MLNDYNKCKTGMGSDELVTTHGYCPRAKKSKQCCQEDRIDEQLSNTCWAFLPAVVASEIFTLLSPEDRKNASCVCKNWRQYIYQPKFWHNMSFTIEPDNLEKARFLLINFAKIVTNARVKVNTLASECTEEFYNLLEAFSDNNNLKELMIEASHCRLELPHMSEEESVYFVANLIEVLKECLPNLNKFSIGCIEELSHNLGDYLEALACKQPGKVTHLGLASVKDMPDDYKSSSFKSILIMPYKNLKILSIDFEQLTDDFLNHLDEISQLERLVVHLHGVKANHPGTTNATWTRFKLLHPQCELRLTVIHAYRDIINLHEVVLRREMPLSHLKVFFCENINMTVLQYSLAYYQNTLKCMMWVDSLNDNDVSWTFVRPVFNEDPDLLVLMSWLCKKLEMIVLYGYKYCEENLIAIARLRGENLKRLEVAEDDVLFCKNDCTRDDDSLIDIPLQMKKPWAPVKTVDLHPVIRNPILGDSDEYLLPIVLADLQ